MKIVFNPMFVSKPYVAIENGLLLDSMVVGETGLLNELELRTGLGGIYESSSTRLVLYSKALGEALKFSPDLFYAESFKNDKIGTTKVLLSWRDALVMAMWDGETYDSKKLEGIKLAEMHFHVKGYSDRWKALHDFASTKDCHPLPGLEIECKCEAEDLQCIVRETLESLQKRGVSVLFDNVSKPLAAKGTDLRTVQEQLLSEEDITEKEKIRLNGDGSFRIIDFGYAYDAYGWIAANLDAPFGQVIVSSDNNRLNDSLRILDKPLVASSVEGCPSEVEVLLLGLSLFHSPVDVNKLLEYLRLPKNPLAELKLKKTRKDGENYLVSLNRELENILLSSGGMIGFDSAVSKALYDSEGNQMDERSRKQILCCIGMWNKADESTNSVRTKDVLEYIGIIKKWSDVNSALNPESGFDSLSDLCNALLLLLDDADGSLDIDVVENWVQGLFSNVVVDSIRAQVGSFDTIDDVRDVYSSPSTLFWIGCVGSDSTGYPYEFLSEKERNFLNVQSKEKYSSIRHKAMIDAICKVRNQFTVVSFATLDGEATSEHPLLTELRARLDVSVEEESLAGDQLEDKIAGNWRTSAMKYRIDPSILEKIDVPVSQGGTGRDVESYSSLDELIQRPFDYVLDYILPLGSYGEQQIQDVAIVKGNVAHSYIEHLVEKGDKDIGTMKRIHQSAMDSICRECAEEVGAVLLTKENYLEYSNFKNVLRRSVNVLLSIIERNSFSIVGSEVVVDAIVPVIGRMTARIDLLLKNPSGRLVVFDFKWSEGSTYEKKMEQHKALQLAVYRALLKEAYGSDPIVSGYYIIPRYEFLTSSPDMSDQPFVNRYVESESVIADEVGNVLFEKACNSYKYRMNQLKSGFIEEGELFVMDNLDYHRQEEELNLYPLDSDYNDPSIKAAAYMGKNIILKGGLS